MTFIVNNATKSASNGQGVWLIGSGLDQVKYAQLLFEKPRPPAEVIAASKSGIIDEANLNRHPAQIKYRDDHGLCIIWQCYSSTTQRHAGWIELDDGNGQKMKIAINKAEMWNRFKVPQGVALLGRNLISKLGPTIFTDVAGNLLETLKQDQTVEMWAAQKDGFCSISTSNSPGYMIVGGSQLGVIPLPVPAADPSGLLYVGQNIRQKTIVPGIPSVPVIFWDTVIDLTAEWASNMQVGRALQNGSAVVGCQIRAGNRGLTGNWQDTFGTASVLGNTFESMGGNPGASEVICLEYVDGKLKPIGVDGTAAGKTAIYVDGPSCGLVSKAMTSPMAKDSAAIHGRIGGNQAYAGNVFRDCVTGIHLFGAGYDVDICGNVFDNVSAAVMLTSEARDSYAEYWPILLPRIADNMYRNCGISVRLVAIVHPGRIGWPTLVGAVMDRNRYYNSPGYSAVFERASNQAPNQATLAGNTTEQAKAIRYLVRTNEEMLTSADRYAYLASPNPASVVDVFQHMAHVDGYIKS